LAIAILSEQGKHTEAVQVFAEFFRGKKGEDGSKADAALSIKQPKEEGDGADEEEVDKTTMQVIDALELEAQLLENADQIQESNAVLDTLVQEHSPDNWDMLCG
jgi:hypothetical protein